jgi:hypothetical protein
MSTRVVSEFLASKDRQLFTVSPEATVPISRVTQLTGNSR